MNNFFRKSFLALFISFALVSPMSVVLAQTAAPLTVPDVKTLPGFEPSSQAKVESGYLIIPFLAQYISAWYKYLVGVSVIIAVIMAMIGGFRYLVGSAMGDVKAGKQMITNAVIGLIVMLSLYTILQTVNPATLEFNTFRIPVVLDESDEGDIIDNPVEIPESAPSEGVKCTLPGVACKTVAECKALCEKPVASRPACSPNVADEKAVKLIENTPGIENVGGVKTLPSVAMQLKEAGKVAASQGMKIKVTSGYRPLARQISLVCAEFAPKGDTGKIGGIIAFPGGSNHGSGRALDIQLWQGKTMLVCSGCSKTQASEKYRGPSETLLKIMTQFGFKRYSKEIWHFEYGTNNSCRCVYGNCPWPPKCEKKKLVS